MKQAYLFVTISFLLSCQPQNTENTESEIKETLTLMWDAIEREDMDTYASYIHPNFTQFGEYEAVLREGKEAEMTGITNWVNESEGIHTEMEDPKVTVRGEVAWITYYWKDRGFTNEVAFSSSGKSTRIFVKEQGKWLCIHGHYTLLEATP